MFFEQKNFYIARQGQINKCFIPQRIHQNQYVVLKAKHDENDKNSNYYVTIYMNN